MDEFKRGAGCARAAADQEWSPPSSDATVPLEMLPYLLKNWWKNLRQSIVALEVDFALLDSIQLRENHLVLSRRSQRTSICVTPRQSGCGCVT